MAKIVDVGTEKKLKIAFGLLVVSGLQMAPAYVTITLLNSFLAKGEFLWKIYTIIYPTYILRKTWILLKKKRRSRKGNAMKIRPLGRLNPGACQPEVSQLILQLCHTRGKAATWGLVHFAQRERGVFGVS